MSILKPVFKIIVLILASALVIEFILRIAFNSWSITHAIRAPDGGTSQRLH